MAENSQPEADVQDEFAEEVAEKEVRRVRARQRRARGVWFGLGTFGLVGWSVAVPTMIGVAIGIWVDTTWPGGFSWTLMLLVAGMVIGCLNAWYWVQRERDAIEEERRR